MTNGFLGRQEKSTARAIPAAAFGAAVLLALSAATGSAQDEARPADAKGGAGPNITQQVQKQTAVALPSLSPIVDRVLPAVVNVSVKLRADAASPVADDEDNEGSPDAGPNNGPGGGGGGPPGTPFDDFLRRFFGQRGMPGTPSPHPRPGGEAMALGSGFIIDPSGYIVTNNHVVAQADKVTVIFQDNSKHPAKVLGRDEKTDLALIKIDASDPLPFVQWGDSDSTKVGDWVVAVGNPFGLGGTVTAGIVSARGRNINEGPYDDFLQIDAPINRGNSGGPTFNLSGEVIGINTAIFSPSGGSIGIGFAIPSTLAKDIVGQIRDKGHVDRGWLGVSIQEISPTIAKSLGLDSNDPQGALVAEVLPNSPAAQAGLKQGDVITSVNGRPIHSAHDLPRLVADMPSGQKLEIAARRGGKEQKITATVAPMPSDKQLAAAQQPQQDADQKPQQDKKAEALGMRLAELTPDLRKRLRVPESTEGVIIRELADDSPAAALGLEPGDVIVSVDQQPVKAPDEAAKKLKAAAAQGQVLLLVNRRGSSRFVGMSVEKGGESTGSSSNKPG